MHRFFRLLARPVTYTRWLHLLIPMAFVAIWLFIDMDHIWAVGLLVVPIGLIPAVRLEEGVQAQLLLTPRERGRPDASIAVAPSATWRDRWRTVLWLEARLALSAVTIAGTVWLPSLSVDLVARGAGSAPLVFGWLAPWLPSHAWLIPLALVPLAVMLLCLVLAGHLVTFLARKLLGPSATERLTALEERTELLLERNRIAREIHDSIGHALTVAVVQAGAARAAGDPAFTDRALAAIEETGRAALEDLERVLLVLRETSLPASQRPTLLEADRLIESARGSGAEVDAEFSGPLELIPGPVSREGYRILQEALTNVLRHSGPVPVRIRMAVLGRRLEMDVTNPLTGAAPGGKGGSGLRGMRERAALLGGEAETGAHEGEWRVRVRLPLDTLI
ncbi:two-component sensor histidine kinase [Streptomyces xanthochromogenes]|uniref:sensor histidine kinase n=1 Tax=Streptomyces TaxID=1883 RepID=UPI001423076D|nr:MULTISPECIES: histidine kinase [Streptomyces]GHB55161.1 two-component sensor histidine kinase [Streptomyces xanthochromogenes]